MHLMDELEDELGLQSRLSEHVLDLNSVQQFLSHYKRCVDHIAVTFRL
jgi:hypothetical protein